MRGFLEDSLWSNARNPHSYHQKVNEQAFVLFNLPANYHLAAGRPRRAAAPDKLHAAEVFVSLPWAGDGISFTGTTNSSLKKFA